MNEEQRVHRLLDDAVPTAPAPTGWADRAAKRTTRRRIGAGAAAVAVLAVAGVFVADAIPRGQRTEVAPASVSPTAMPTPTSAPTGEVAVVTALVGPVDGPPTLCIRGMLESRPPGCMGAPELLGDFSWDDVEYEEASGVRWTDWAYRFIGVLDLEAGTNGTLTLTRPVEKALPASGSEEKPDYSRLCDDPLRKADPALTDDGGHNRLMAKIEKLETVSVWVSDRVSEFNVLVNGDPEAAYADLRAVWGGGLCVAASDASTLTERNAAMNRVMAALPKGEFVTASADSSDPRDPKLAVTVVVVDDDIRAVIEKAAGPGIELDIEGVFTPYEP